MCNRATYGTTLAPWRASTSGSQTALAACGGLTSSAAASASEPPTWGPTRCPHPPWRNLLMRQPQCITRGHTVNSRAHRPITTRRHPTRTEADAATPASSHEPVISTTPRAPCTACNLPRAQETQHREPRTRSSEQAAANQSAA